MAAPRPKTIEMSSEQKWPPSRKEPVLVSACLLGIACCYDGGSKRSDRVRDFLKNATVIPVCPETLGGLKRPRSASELQGCTGGDVLKGRGRVIDRQGKDLTDDFIKGAIAVLEIARKSGAKKAILKSRSPSCGTKAIYDGTFQDRTLPGMGVTAALLKSSGIEVMSEEEVKNIMDEHDGIR